MLAIIRHICEGSEPRSTHIAQPIGLMRPEDQGLIMNECQMKLEQSPIDGRVCGALRY